MNYLALQMLFEDRGKYFAMLAGICFASLIMTQQPAIFVGLMARTYSFIDDINAADIWVMDPGVQYSEEHKPIRDVDLQRVRGIPGVRWAAPMFKGIVMATLPDGTMRSVDLTGLDDDTLMGAPPMAAGHIIDLHFPDAIVVDRNAAQDRLRVHLPGGTTRPLAIGDVMQLNDHRAVVVGYANMRRNFVLQPDIFTTYSRALEYSPPYRKQLSYVLVKAESGADLAALARRISQATGLAAYSSDAFRNLNYNYWMIQTGIPVNFGVSVLLGFMVGAAIAGQVFFNFVRENVQQFAALKAMGATGDMLTRMVFLQALVVAATGYGLGVGLSALFGLAAHDSALAYQMRPVLLLFAGGGVLIIVASAALLAIRRVKAVDPVLVFRT
jgi:putative ABC transport system permease protein